MAQRKGKIAKELSAWRCRTRDAVPEICRKRSFLAIQTVLVLRAEDEKSKLFLALA